jgi:hypothetical protein
MVIWSLSAMSVARELLVSRRLGMGALETEEIEFWKFVNHHFPRTQRGMKTRAGVSCGCCGQKRSPPFWCA